MAFPPTQLQWKETDEHIERNSTLTGLSICFYRKEWAMGMVELQGKYGSSIQTTGEGQSVPCCWLHRSSKGESLHMTGLLLKGGKWDSRQLWTCLGPKPGLAGPRLLFFSALPPNPTVPTGKRSMKEA